MLEYSTIIRNLQREWIADPAVHRVAGDDDGLAPTALLRPTTPLTKAVAALLQGAGFVQPHGEDVFVVRWRE